MVSLLIQAGATTVLDHDLLAGLVNMRAALAKLAGGEALPAASSVVPLAR